MKRSAVFLSSQKQYRKKMKLGLDDGFLEHRGDLISDTDDSDKEEEFPPKFNPTDFLDDLENRKILHPKRKYSQKTTSTDYVTYDAAIILQLINLSQFTSSFLCSGAFEAERLSTNDETSQLIFEYVRNSQPHNFNVTLVSVLKINQPKIKYPTEKRFSMMLWHGTKPNLVAPILENGFKCPENTGQLFGEGIYFADRISKSAQYCNEDGKCRQPTPGDVDYIFLCEVSLGHWYSTLVPISKLPEECQVDTESNGKPRCKDSLKGIGKYIPDIKRQKILEDGTVWPMGPTVKNFKYPKYALCFNEYVVYSSDQVKIKYLLKVRFWKKRVLLI